MAIVMQTYGLVFRIVGVCSETLTRAQPMGIGVFLPKTPFTRL